MHWLVTRAAIAGALLSLVVPLSLSASAREDGAFTQVNLVSNIVGRARLHDENLKNPWGLVHSATSPWWISDNNAGVSTLYTGAGAAVPLQGPPSGGDLRNAVNIPPPSGSPAGSVGAPTGVVFNATKGFAVSENGVTAPAAFVFATEDGTLAGWSAAVDRKNAILGVDNPNTDSGPVYKGLAIAQDDERTFLFAANFRFGTVDVFDSNFHQVKRAGAFVDHQIPDGFAPFGIQNINGRLYVTYAMQNAAKHDDVKGAGNGFVDVFSTDGRLLRRLVRRGELNSPWGLALAPEDFGPFGGALLVGNFGDGTINAYDVHSGHFRGTLRDNHGARIVIEGL